MSESALQFLNPDRLWLLVAIIPAVVLLTQLFERRAAARARLKLPPERFLARRGIVVAILFLLCAALSRPYLGSERLTFRQEGHDVVFLVDVSYSMLAQDESPSRLAVAKQTVLDIIKQSQSAALQNRFAIVAFAGDAYLFCPLTSDYGILKSYVEALSPALLSAEGSDLGAAVKQGIDALSHGGAPIGIIVTLSDGETERADTTPILQELKPRGIPLYAIGIGSPEGAPIPTRSGQYLQGPSGATVITSLNESVLRALAEGSGGAFTRVSLTDEDIAPVKARLLALEDSTKGGESAFTVYHEIAPLFAWVILALCCLLILLRRSGLILPLILFHLLPLTPTLAQENGEAVKEPPSLYQSFLAYSTGDYATALRGFSAASQSRPDNPRIKKALGDTLFRLGRYSEAQEAYSEVLQGKVSDKWRAESYYNRGNAKLAAKDYRGAIEDYTTALSIAPNDRFAKENREIAERLLIEEQKPPQQRTPDPTQQSSSSSSSQQEMQSERSRSSSEGSPSSSSSPQTSSSDSESPVEDSPSSSESSASPSGSSDSSSSAGENRSDAESDNRSQSSSSEPSPRDSEDSSSSSSGTAPAEDSNPQSSEAGSSERSPEGAGGGGGDNGTDNARQSHGQSSSESESRSEAWEYLNSLEDKPLLLSKDNKRRSSATGQRW